MNKKCCKCKLSKNKEEFNKNKKRYDGLNSYCRLCTKQYNSSPERKQYRKQYKKTHPEVDKTYQKKYRKTPKGKENEKNKKLKYHYGITLKEYDNILKSQNNKCAICKSENPGGQKSFHVDHNHLTNKIRGLLCSKCNHGIGLFNDNINVLTEAIKYLTMH
jgi:hypothetical protein